MSPPSNWAGRRVLVVRPGALGDAVLTLPLLVALTQAGARVAAILGTPAAFAFLRPDAAPPVHDFGSRDWLGLFGGPLSPAARTVLAEVDSAVICLQPGPAAAVAAVLADAGLTAVVVAPPPERHTRGGPHCAARLVAGAFPPAPASRPVVLPSVDRSHPWLLPMARECADASALLAGLMAPPGFGTGAARPIILHPGSGGAHKAMAPSLAAALLEALIARGDVQPLLLEGPADGPLCGATQGALAERVPSLACVPVLRGLSLRQLLAVCAKVQVVIVRDSGLAHLAALAAPTIVGFGPTDPACWAPRGPAVVVLEPPHADDSGVVMNAVSACL